jgi:hypothetical protein
MTLPMSAQGPGVRPIPELSPPGAARVSSSGGYGFPVAAQQGNPGIRSTGLIYRMTGAGPVEAALDNYITQLKALGWTQTLRQVDPQLGFARFSVGDASDPSVGMLWIVPFASSGQTVASVRLVRAKSPWINRNPGRPGGAGANANAKTVAPVLFSFGTLTGPLDLSSSVSRFEQRGGGGSSDQMHADVRLETTTSPVDLFATMEKQIGNNGWNRDSKQGDARQVVVRRSAASDARSEIWALTAMPGVPEVDGFVLSICADRPAPPARTPGQSRLPPDHTSGHKCGAAK